MNRRNMKFRVKVKTFIVFMLCVIMMMAAASAVYAGGLEIQWDFSNGKFIGEQPPFVVTRGSFIIVRVLNINLKKFNVTIDGRLVNYNTTAPPLIAGQKVDPKTVEGAITPEKEDVTEPMGLLPEAETAAQALEQLKSLRKQLHDIPGKLQDIRERMSKIKKFPVQLEITLYSAETFNRLRFNTKQLFKAFMGLEDDDPEAVNQKELIKSLKTRLEQVTQKFESIKNECAELSDRVNDKIAEFEELIKNKSEEFTKLEKKDPQKAKTLKEEIEKEKSLLEEEKSLMEKETTLIEKEKSLTGQMLEEFDVDEYIKALKSLLGEFIPENFSTSRTFSGLDADKVEIKVDITPVNPKDRVTHGLGTPIEVSVRGGWKFDFSTGVMFHINAHDRAYRLEESPDDPNKVVIKEDTHKRAITPVMGALMHVYWRTDKPLVPTITFGLGTGLAESLSYYAGLGCILGSKRRFIISGGLALVKYARLLPEYKEKYDNGDDLPKSSDLTADKLVKPDYKLRWFVSFTYNF
jgi:hypothetical protein